MANIQAAEKMSFQALTYFESVTECKRIAYKTTYQYDVADMQYEQFR